MSVADIVNETFLTVPNWVFTQPEVWTIESPGNLYVNSKAVHDNNNAIIGLNESKQITFEFKLIFGDYGEIYYRNSGIDVYLVCGNATYCCFFHIGRTPIPYSGEDYYGAFIYDNTFQEMQINEGVDYGVEVKWRLEIDDEAGTTSVYKNDVLLGKYNIMSNVFSFSNMLLMQIKDVDLTFTAPFLVGSGLWSEGGGEEPVGNKKFKSVKMEEVVFKNVGMGNIKGL
jgi:hypothetical protein